MSSFLLDVWHDLRAKKLWPVAIALALALIAVPVFLARSAPEAPVSSAPSAPPASAEGLPAVAVTDEPAPGGSDLQLFSSRDPFRVSGSAGAGSGEAPSTASSPDAPGAGTQSGTAIDAGSALTAPGGSGGGSGSAAAGAAGRGGSRSGSSAVGAPSGEGSSGSPSSGSVPSSPPSSTDAPGGSRSRFYTYAAIVEFGLEGDERRRSLENLEALPSEREPLIVLLGVSRDGEAVFLLDPRVTQRGEGRCQPSPEVCTFLRLRDKPDQDAHIIVGPDEQIYKLRLVELRRELDSGAGGGEAPAGDARARSASARGGRLPTRAKRRADRAAFERLPFDFPFFGARRAR